MATVHMVVGDARVTGTLTVNGQIKGPRTRSELTQEDLAVYPQCLTSFRVWDAQATNLPATGGTDDLGLYTGTWGTHAPKMSTGDVKAAGAVTRRAAVVMAIPVEFVTGETIKIRISAATETTVADSSSTVDAEAYLVGRDGTIDGSDLVTTAATTINSTTWGDKDFVVDTATLSPGDELFVRITIAVTDNATVTTVQPSIGAVELLCDIKG